MDKFINNSFLVKYFTILQKLDESKIKKFKK